MSDEKRQAYLDQKARDVFFHTTPVPDACKHDFKGWRPFADGLGGETVCAKCGMGAMSYSLRTGP